MDKNGSLLGASNSEKRLLASSRLSVCLSERMDGISWNLILEYFSNICQANLSFWEEKRLFNVKS